MSLKREFIDMLHLIIDPLLEDEEGENYDIEEDSYRDICMKYIFGIVIVLAIILVAVTIGANNDQLITFNYIVAKSELRLSSLVAILFGFGLILGWFITGFFYLKVKLQNIALNRRVKRQAQQISELSLPKAE